MAAKFTLFALFAVIALQGFTEAMHLGFRMEERTVGEDFEKFMDKVKEYTQNVTEQGLAELEQAYADLVASVHKELEKTQTEVNDAAEETEKHIALYQQSAKYIEVDITECFTANQEKINELVEKVGKTIYGCAHDIVAEVQTKYHQAQDVIKASDEKVASILTKLDECKDFDCISTIGEEIVTEIAEASHKVEEIVYQAVSTFKTSLPSAIACIREALAPYKDELKAIVTDVKNCINDKISEAEKPTHRMAKRSLEDDFQVFAEKLQEFNDNVTVQGFYELAQAYINVVAALQKELENSQEDVEHAAEVAKMQIASIQRSAGYVEIDVTECFAAHQEKIDELVEKVGKTVYGCAHDIIAQVQTTYNKAQEVIKASEDKMTALFEQLHECRDFECMSTVGDEIFAEMEQSREHVREVVAEGVAAFKSALPSAVACIREAVAPYKDELTALVADVKKCIDGKFNDATHNEEPAQYRMAKRSLEDDFQVFAEKLQEFNENVTVQGFYELAQAYLNVVAALQKELENSQEDVQQAAEVAKMQIAAIQRSAGYVEIDVTECFAAHQEKIDELVEKVGKTVYGCAHDIIAQVQITYNKAQEVIKASEDKMTALFEQLHECRDFECMSTVGDEIFAEMEQSREHVREVVAEGVAAFKSALPSAVACIREAVAPYKDELTALVADVKKCIDGKFNDATHNEEPAQSRMAKRSLEDDFQVFAEKLQEFNENVTVQGFYELAQAYINVVAALQKELENNQEDVQQAAEVAKMQIAAIQRSAGYVEIDVTECFAAHQEKIDELVEKVGKTVYGCAHDIIAQVQTTYNKAQEVIKASEDKMTALFEQLHECKDFECMSTVGDEIFAEMEQSREHVREVVAEGVAAFKSALPSAVACIREAVAPYKDELTALVTDVKKCIDGKFAEAQ